MLESHYVTSARRARIFSERRSRVSERKLEWVAGLPALGTEEHQKVGADDVIGVEGIDQNVDWFP